MAGLGTDEVVVQIVRFETKPERQHALIDAVSAETERWVRNCPGFISATFHASDDGRQMLNYAMWRSHADFHAFLQHPEGPRLGEAIRATEPVSGPEGMTFRLMRTINGEGEL